MTASDFICDEFFIFSIIKNFRHEKKAFRAKKSRLVETGFTFSIGPSLLLNLVYTFEKWVALS